MSDGSQVEVSDESNIKQTALGSMEFAGSLESKDPLALPTTPAPEGVPEKFWDPIKGALRTDDLLKSYQFLETKLGAKGGDEADGDDASGAAAGDAAGDDAGGEDAPGEDAPGEDDDKGDAGDKGDEAQANTPEFQVAMDEAQKVYAETGELPEEQRKPFLDLGFTDQQIDLYLNGVKATESALTASAYKAAGGEDGYKAAVTWAAENWSEKQIRAFNSQTGDIETIGTAVAGLMAAFRSANPGEGKLTNINSGLTRGDVYESMDEFQADLSNADRIRDKVARRKAVDKLRRSREAGTIKHSHRRQPFGG